MNTFIYRFIAGASLLLLCIQGVQAQPSVAKIKKDFGGAGVVSVTITTSPYKTWDEGYSKYCWSTSLTVVSKVDPKEVDGLKGVKRESWWVASYDIGSNTMYWSNASGGQYIGIDLPLPTKEETVKLLNDNAESFLRMTRYTVSIDDIKLSGDSSWNWNTPREVTGEGMMLYKEISGNDAVAQFTVPLTFELKRETLKSPWEYKGGAEKYESRKELSRQKYSADEIRTMPTLKSRKLVSAFDARFKASGIAMPPKFSSPEELGRYTYKMLNTLNKEQMSVYLSLVFLHNEGTQSFPYNLYAYQSTHDKILEAAYDGAANFKSQFCSSPNKFSVNGGSIFFSNKAGGQGGSITTNVSGGEYKDGKKVNQSYFITDMNLFVRKSADAVAELNSYSSDKLCRDTASVTATGGSTAGGSIASGGNWKVGDAVQVEDGGKWYPSKILKADGNKYFIHYDGYDAKYDIWVTPSRMRASK